MSGIFFVLQHDEFVIFDSTRLTVKEHGMDRYIIRSGKDHLGNIISLCNPGAWWSPRSAWDVINDIRTGTHRYLVAWADGITTEVGVVNGTTGLYLRTDRDNTIRNNLDDLADC